MSATFNPPLGGTYSHSGTAAVTTNPNLHPFSPSPEEPRWQRVEALLERIATALEAKEHSLQR